MYIYTCCVYSGMAVTENVIDGLAFVIKNGIKITLVAFFSVLIGLFVYALINPKWAMDAILHSLPVLFVGLVVIAIAGKILRSLE